MNATASMQEQEEMAKVIASVVPVNVTLLLLELHKALEQELEVPAMKEILLRLPEANKVLPLDMDLGAAPIVAAVTLDY